MVYIYVSHRGCRTTSTDPIQFRCEMCHPKVINGDYKVIDNARACAMSKINKGLICYYFDIEYEDDKLNGKKVIKSMNLVEKWKKDKVNL